MPESKKQFRCKARNFVSFLHCRLILTSRSGVRTGYQARCIHFWRKSGVTVDVSTLNISDEEETEQLILQAQDNGGLGGVFQLAMVLRDCLFENQTTKNFQESAEAKYYGTQNLDKVTRKICGNDLKW